MKKIYPIAFSTAAVTIAVLVSAYSTGPAHNNTEATGAPGDNFQCTSCHTGNAFGTQTVVTMLNTSGQQVTSFMPDSLYKVRVTIQTATAPSAYGFQLVAIKDADESSVGTLQNASSNASIIDLNNRTYAEHPTPSDTNVFEVEWKAPAAGAGDVTFYVGGNAVNLNGKEDDGDNPDMATLTVSEDGFNGVADFREETAFSVYPVPAVDHIMVSTQDMLHAGYSLYDLSGRTISEGVLKGNEHKIALDGLTSGRYIIRLETGQSRVFMVK